MRVDEGSGSEGREALCGHLDQVTVKGRPECRGVECPTPPLQFRNKLKKSQ